MVLHRDAIGLTDMTKSERQITVSRKSSFWKLASRRARALSFVAAMLLVAGAFERAAAHAIVVRTSPAQGGVAVADIGKVTYGTTRA